MTPNTDARPRARRLTVLLAGALTLMMFVVPLSVAEAQTGSTSAEAAPSQSSPGTLRASVSRRHLPVGQRVRVSGSLSSGEAGRQVRVQRRAGKGWKTVVKARTGASGRFSASYRLRNLGSYRLRARLVDAPASASSAGTKPATVTAYRRTHASWYGPGLYGNRLGCGGRLTTRTLGVAHKTLPCGTKVTFRYRGRSVTARVIDRGPYIAGRTWDLTAPLKRALRFPSTGTVWSSR